MSYYVVESPHEPQEHGRAVSEILGMAPGSQLAFLWSCHMGVHKAWAFIEADGQGEALDTLPYFLRARASAHRVERFGADESAGVWELELDDELSA